MPFKAQEIQDKGGIYYGKNAVSGNLIICDRKKLMNSNGFIFGVSGSGKSMAAKQEFISVALDTDDDIIIVDPEREYGNLVSAMGGETIIISNTGGSSYINPMDISAEYGEDKDPLKLKSSFLMSLFEQLTEGKIKPTQKSIIDRCAGNVYREYLKTFRGDPPTLKDLYIDLKKQVEPGAEELALILELFTTGSLDVFAHHTNINSDNRILCFDIHDLGESLKSVGLLVMLDAIYNRVIRNRSKGKYTHVYIDEIYLFFAASGDGGQARINQFSSEFLYKCWKRFRKYGAMLTGITQNVEECLESERGKYMFGNSEFMLMFNQAAKMRFMFGGKAKVPMVLRMPQGAGVGAAAQHSQCLEAWFMHIPGIKVCIPATPADAKGLLVSAIRDDNPVVFLEHKLLYGIEGEVDDDLYEIPLGKGKVVREGSDVTIVATALMVHRALEAAEILAKDGISVEVVDPRTLVPLDKDCILDSVRKTHALVVVHEAVKNAGAGAEIAAMVAEEAIEYLDAPIVRIGAPFCPVPFSPTLEQAYMPSVEKIVQAVREQR